MKKLLALLLVLTMAFSCLAGCDSSDSDSDSKKDKVSDSDDAEDREDKDSAGSGSLDGSLNSDANNVPAVGNAESVVGTYAFLMDSDYSDMGLDSDLAELISYGLDIWLVITLEDDGTATFSFDMATGDDLMDLIIDLSIEMVAESNDMTYDEVMDLLVEEYGSEDAAMDAIREELEPSAQEMEELFDEMTAEFNEKGTYTVEYPNVYITYDGEEAEFYFDGTNLIYEEENWTFEAR